MRLKLAIFRLFERLRESNLSKTVSDLGCDPDYLAYLIGIGPERRSAYAKPISVASSSSTLTFDSRPWSETLMLRYRLRYRLKSCRVDLGSRVVNPMDRQSLRVYCARSVMFFFFLFWLGALLHYATKPCDIGYMAV